MVRLKDLLEDQTGTLHVEFQFHYGTIKSVRPCFRHTEEHAFQFHYGTIKSGESAQYSRLTEIFQFHYGTIKRSSAALLIVPPPLFQFHYGTIKSYQPFDKRKGYHISIPLWYD